MHLRFHVDLHLPLRFGLHLHLHVVEFGTRLVELGTASAEIGPKLIVTAVPESSQNQPLRSDLLNFGRCRTKFGRTLAIHLADSGPFSVSSGPGVVELDRIWPKPSSIWSTSALCWSSSGKCWSMSGKAWSTSGPSRPQFGRSRAEVGRRRAQHLSKAGQIWPIPGRNGRCRSKLTKN